MDSHRALTRTKKFTMPIGYLALVLHAHLPFVRHPEYDDFLEEDWLYEAITETYIPLLEVMDGLQRDVRRHLLQLHHGFDGQFRVFIQTRRNWRWSRLSIGNRRDGFFPSRLRRRQCSLVNQNFSKLQHNLLGGAVADAFDAF